MSPSRVSADQWAEVDELLDNDVPIREINRRTGVTRPAISKRRDSHPSRPLSPPADGPSRDEPPRKPRTDPPPRARRPRAGAGSSPRKTGPTDEQLESMCRKIAKAPAIPAKLVLHCDYCANHFQLTAPALAAELVAMSHEDADLRAILDGLYTNWRRYAAVGLVVSWAGVPLLHHAAPRVLYGAIAPIVGMPPRGAPMPHAHPSPAAGGAPPPPAAPPSNGAGAASDFENMVTPFDGLDVEQLLAMARQFGIELPEGVTAEQLAAMLDGGTVDVEPTMNDEDAAVSDTDLSAGSDPAAGATDSPPAEAAGADPAA